MRKRKRWSSFSFPFQVANLLGGDSKTALFTKRKKGKSKNEMPQIHFNKPQSHIVKNKISTWKVCLNLLDLYKSQRSMLLFDPSYKPRPNIPQCSSSSTQKEKANLKFRFFCETFPMDSFSALCVPVTVTQEHGLLIILFWSSLFVSF
jgi:hypothetical protein